jgi:hypothetical protein
MGKSLLELLQTFPFEPSLNPNKQTDNMLNPDPSSAFDTNIKQSKAWLKATPKLYGADIVRIMSQGQVDTKKIKKAAVKVASNLASKIPIVGGVVGGAISQLTNPKLPGDLYTGTSEFEPEHMVTSLYTDLLYGRIRNDKGALGNFLKDNTSLKNLGQNLKNVAVSAAIGGATKVAAAGLDALINKKKFSLKKKKLPAVKAPLGELQPDNFPSTFAFQSGVTDRIAVNQSQFTNRPGVLGGTFGAGYELGKEQSKIKVTRLSNNPTQDGLIKGTSNRLNDFYKSNYKRLEGNLDGFVPSFNLWEASDGKNGNAYNYSKVNTTGNSLYLGTDTTLDITATVSQNFGANTTNLIKIVKGKNDYTFDVKTDNGSNKFIGNIKGGEDYIYTKSELKINTLTTDEQSRFIDGGIADLGESKLIKGMGAQNVETQVGQLFGNAFIAVDIDTKKPEEYKYPFRTIGQMDTVARWNTKDAKFSDNVKTITDNDTNFLNTALQTQTNTSLNINPYLHSKRDVLKDNVEDGIVKVNIGGINFLSTITNLSDKSAASWDSVKPIGSGVNFYLFNVWERDISFDLKLYAENKTQLDQIWKKVESLSLYTKGKTTNSVKGVFGRIIGLEIGDLISAQGFLSDITMSVDDATPWEITKGSQAPMICSISISFKVVTNGEANYSFYNTLKA